MNKSVKILFAVLCCSVWGLSSCEKVPLSDDESSGLSGLAVLNEGSWGGNNSSVLSYDDDSGSLVDMFLQNNGKSLGDTAQDIIVAGDDVYIAVNTSQIIFVTDREFKIKKEIVAGSGGGRLSPRYFATDGKKIYVTYYEGYLGEINPSDDYKLRITAVGPNPEGVAYADGKLYVANSGGYNYPDYNNTLSVVDAALFAETSVIEVNVNPCLVAANSSGTAVYVSSFGNYSDCPPMLQSVSTADLTVKNVDCDGISSMAYGGNDRLYVLCAGYDSSYNPLPGTVYMYNAGTGAGEGVFAEGIDNAYKISADAGHVFVTSSDYKNTGDMTVYSASGKRLAKFDTGGLNPGKGLFIR